MEEESLASSLTSSLSSALDTLTETVMAAPASASASAEAKAEAKVEAKEGEEIIDAAALAAVAVAPVEAAPPLAVKRRPRGPKVLKAPKDANTFFKAMSENPKKYAFSPSGDMAILTDTGEIETTLPLPSYRETTEEERKEYDLGVKEQIRSVEKQYDEALKNLKQATLIWKETGIGSDAIQLQRELTTLDAKRSSLRSPLRWVRSYRNLERRQLFLHSKQPDLTVGHPVYSLYIQSIPFEKQVVEGSVDKPNTKVAAEPEKGKEESFIVFSTPSEEEYGVLTPDTKMDVTYNGTRYNSILQAYYAERVGQLGNQGLRTSILKSTNPNTIRFMGTSMKGMIENPSPRELIINIVSEAAKQDARFAPVLRKTGTDFLVYAHPKDAVLAIGLSVEDKDLVTQRDAWKGENLLGQAWEVVRGNLPKEDESVQSGGAVLEKARTLDDVKKERSHVLMGMYRKKSHAHAHAYA